MSHDTTNPPRSAFHKATASGGDGDACVEAAYLQGVSDVVMRDSKTEFCGAADRRLVLPVGAFATLRTAARQGRFTAVS